MFEMLETVFILNRVATLYFNIVRHAKEICLHVHDTPDTPEK